MAAKIAAVVRLIGSLPHANSGLQYTGPEFAFHDQARMDPIFIFVYGTLREGGAHSMPGLYPRAKFIGNASVGGRLYDLGEYPALELDERGAEVFGEVYGIDDIILDPLDRLEESAAFRRLTTVVHVQGRELPCIVYCPDPQTLTGKPVIESGDWMRHIEQS